MIPPRLPQCFYTRRGKSGEKVLIFVLVDYKIALKNLFKLNKQITHYDEDLLNFRSSRIMIKAYFSKLVVFKICWFKKSWLKYEAELPL